MGGSQIIIHCMALHGTCLSVEPAAVATFTVLLYYMQNFIAY